MLTGFDRKLAHWRSLTAPQRSVLLQSTVLLPLVWLGLRTLGLARMQRALTLRRPGAPIPMPLRDIQALGEAANMAARRSPFPTTCLTRSLLLRWLLARRGIASQLRIGVRLEGAVLRAHAWVECQGLPVNDVPDVASRFAPFDDPIATESFQAP